MSLPQRFIARGSCKSLLQIVRVSGKVQKHIHNAVNQLRRYVSLAQEMLLSEMDLGIFLRLRVRKRKLMKKQMSSFFSILGLSGQAQSVPLMGVAMANVSSFHIVSMG